MCNHICKTIYQYTNAAYMLQFISCVIQKITAEFAVLMHHLNTSAAE